MLNKLFKSIIDQDNANIVVCNLDHKIVYMNPIACERYAKRGGATLVGRSLMDCHNADSQEKIRKVVAWFAADKSHNRVHTFFNDKQNKDGYMVALRDEDGSLIGYYEKHEYRDVDTTGFYNLV